MDLMKIAAPAYHISSTGTELMEAMAASMEWAWIPVSVTAWAEEWREVSNIPTSIHRHTGYWLLRPICMQDILLSGVGLLWPWQFLNCVHERVPNLLYWGSSSTCFCKVHGEVLYRDVDIAPGHTFTEEVHDGSSLPNNWLPEKPSKISDVRIIYGVQYLIFSALQSSHFLAGALLQESQFLVNKHKAPVDSKSNSRRYRGTP